MPQRDIPAPVRAAIEDASAPDAIMACVTVTHPDLDEPIRIVSDTLDYTYGGHLYIGLLFSWGVMDDGEGAPQAELTLPDTDRRIGEALRQASGEARVTVHVLSSSDFDLSVVPRVPVGTPAPVYVIPNLVLLSASADGQQIACQIGLRDYSQEPWPCIYATELRLPGLYR